MRNFFFFAALVIAGFVAQPADAAWTEKYGNANYAWSLQNASPNANGNYMTGTNAIKGESQTYLGDRVFGWGRVYVLDIPGFFQSAEAKAEAEHNWQRDFLARGQGYSSAKTTTEITVDYTVQIKLTLDSFTETDDISWTATAKAGKFRYEAHYNQGTDQLYVKKYENNVYQGISRIDSVTSGGYHIYTYNDSSESELLAPNSYLQLDAQCKIDRDGGQDENDSKWYVQIVAD